MPQEVDGTISTEALALPIASVTYDYAPPALEIADSVLTGFRRREVSISWRETSLPHMLGYGTSLFIAEQALVYPSNVLKTLLQIDNRCNTKLSTEIGTLSRHILKEQGFRGFYRGFAFNTLCGLPPQICHLVTYNWCKEKCEDIGGQPVRDTGMAPLAAGAASAGVTSAFWVPHSIILQRLMIARGFPIGWEAGNEFVQRWALYRGERTRGAWRVLKEVIREGGLCGLWRGTGAHFCSVVPQTAIWWATYEKLKHGLTSFVGQQYDGIPIHMLAGIGAGATAATVTNPLDLIKVRIQTQVLHHTLADRASPWRILTTMIKTEGLSSLGKGLAPKIWFGVPLSAASSVCYELIMSLSRSGGGGSRMRDTLSWQ